MPTASATAVGGFVLGGLGIVVAAGLFFGATDVTAHKDKAVVYFEGSVDGLHPGAPVTFRGVRVGSVAKVVLVIEPKSMQARIPVYLKLEPDRVTLAGSSTDKPMLPQLIEAGLRAKLESESLVTGQMFVELDLAPNQPGHVVDGADPKVPEIPTIPSDLEELRSQLTHAPIADTVVQAKQTLAAVEKLADRLNSEIDPLAIGVQRMLDGATRTFDVAGASIQDLQKEAAATLDELHGLAADGRRQLDARGAELSHTLTAAQKTLKASDELIMSANSIVVRGSRSRDDLEAALRDLAASASTLRDLSQAIDRDPSIVLRGRAAR